MTLNWQVHKNLNPFSPSAEGIEHAIHRAAAAEYDESAINSAVILCIDKAVSLLGNNIDDNSRYFIFEWDVIHSTLSIAVTNDKKECDSPAVVQCDFSGLADHIKAVKNTSDIAHSQEIALYTESVTDIARDYLTTCPDFFRYSLVAIFHTGDRSNSLLL